MLDRRPLTVPDLSNSFPSETFGPRRTDVEDPSHQSFLGPSDKANKTEIVIQSHSNERPECKNPNVNENSLETCQEHISNLLSSRDLINKKLYGTRQSFHYFPLHASPFSTPDYVKRPQRWCVRDIPDFVGQRTKINLPSISTPPPPY